jgi:hypothetical protein
MTDQEIDRVLGVVNRWADEQRDRKHALRDSHATLSG